VGSSIEEIGVDGANPNYFASGPFLIAFDGLRLIRHFAAAADGPRRSIRLTEIGPFAFSEISRLTSLCIPASIEIIGDGCFRGCTSLSRLDFESGSRLTRIGEASFRECSSLTSICIPAHVTAIPRCCFSECHSLSKLLFEPGSELVRIDRQAFQNCHSLRSLVVPSRLPSIQSGTLSSCKSLCELVFEAPSCLKWLDLPRSGFSCLCIPDSVVTVYGNIASLDGQRRVLQFGRDSRLRLIDLNEFISFSPSWVRELGNQIFIRLSEEILRRFRRRFEA
jgi:hypothetical protein